MPTFGSVTSKQIRELLKQQEYRCALSGRDLTPETASLDHVVPLSRDGSHDIRNVQIVDYQVNTAKGSLTVEEFTVLCQDVVAHLHHVKAKGPCLEK